MNVTRDEFGENPDRGRAGMYDIGNGIKASGLIPMSGNCDVDRIAIGRIPAFRADRIERMAKAVYAKLREIWTMENLVTGDPMPVWDDADENMRNEARLVAEAAYDAL